MKTMLVIGCMAMAALTFAEASVEKAVSCAERARCKPDVTEPPTVSAFCRRAERGDRLTVAFLGCSLTWGANATDPNRTSWRALVGKRLEATYPNAHFSFVDAAIGGTDSQLGVFRIDRDVASYRPDLVFVDFSVNDGISGANDNRSCSYEGVLRQLMRKLPGCVLVQVILPVQKTMTEDALEKLLRRSEHIRLGDMYNLVRADVLLRCRELYAAGKADPRVMWPKEIGDTTHPHDLGYGLYADIVWDEVFLHPSDKLPTLPSTPLFAPKYERTCRRRLFDLPMASGWKKDYNKMRAGTFDFLCSRWQDGVANASEGAESIHLRFRGEVLHIFGESTVRGGVCEVLVDGKSRGSRDFSAFARKFDPSAYLEWQICSDLDPLVEHSLEIRPDFSNGGSEVRIESICVAGRSAAEVTGPVSRTISLEDFRDRMQGAWIGQSVGVAYGWPTEFICKGSIIPDEKMPVWKPESINETFSQDDLYVEMTFIKTLLERGIDVSSREAGIEFANSAYRLWCANSNARNNLRNGIAAPDSSHPKFHPTTDDIDYQIEADYSGILAPGMPQAAVDLGETFGRIMNYGDGLYAGQFVGAMYAEAYFVTDRVEVVERALQAIPAESKYAAMVRDLVEWYRADPKDWRGAWRKAVDRYQSPEMLGKVSFKEIDVKINGAMVLLGFLFGEGDMDRTMYIATAGGYDSDCNPSTACGVLGTMIGYRRLDAKFRSSLSATNKWEFTAFDWKGLVAASEILARQLVVKHGGRIVKDAAGAETFEIPVHSVRPSPHFDSKAPGPLSGEKELTAAERERIRYLPCAKQGGQSELRR